jgi:tRNA(His) guanylyltransferase
LTFRSIRRKLFVMKDDLGKRMKENYEQRTRSYIPRRTFTIIRVDGKAFHTFTKNSEKPFDNGIESAMNSAALHLVENIQGAQLAYVQSDEISILLTDFAKHGTDAWYDGQIQKMASVSASLATVGFNHSYFRYGNPSVDGMALFDSRVFCIPERTEVANYFVWRNKDAARNSVSMVAQSKFSHKQLQGKNTSEMQEMLFQEHGINWSTYDESRKNGRLFMRNLVSEAVVTTDDGDVMVRSLKNWLLEPAWEFSKDFPALVNLIPNYD